jgi:hypothetical protein
MEVSVDLVELVGPVALGVAVGLVGTEVRHRLIPRLIRRRVLRQARALVRLSVRERAA